MYAMGCNPGKAETIASTAFKQHLHLRCLIPADGFYEF